MRRGFSEGRVVRGQRSSKELKITQSEELVMFLNQSEACFRMFEALRLLAKYIHAQGNFLLWKVRNCNDLISGWCCKATRR